MGWTEEYSKEELLVIVDELQRAVSAARTALFCIKANGALKPEVNHWYIKDLPALIDRLTPINYTAKATFDAWVGREKEQP